MCVMDDLPEPERGVIEELDRRGVGYERVPCDPEFADTAAFCERYGYPVSIAANAIVCATKREPRRFCVCVVLGTRRLDVNRRVRDLLGAGRVSFARPQEMRELTGMEVGGVTPFALPAGLPVYVDGAMMGLDRVIVGTGGRTSKVLVPPSALADLPGAEVIEDLSTPEATAGGTGLA